MPKKPTPPCVVDAQKIAIIDEFGRLDAKLALLKPDRDRHDALRKVIQSWYSAENAIVGYVCHGIEYSCIVGAKARERSITNMPRLAKLLGKRLIEICTVPLREIDRLFDVEQQKEFLIETHTGSRTVTPIPRSATIAPPDEQKRPKAA